MTEVFRRVKDNSWSMFELDDEEIKKIEENTLEYNINMIEKILKKSGNNRPIELVLGVFNCMCKKIEDEKIKYIDKKIFDEAKRVSEKSYDDL